MADLKSLLKKSMIKGSGDVGGALGGALGAGSVGGESDLKKLIKEIVREELCKIKSENVIDKVVDELEGGKKGKKKGNRAPKHLYPQNAAMKATKGVKFSSKEARMGFIQELASLYDFSMTKAENEKILRAKVLSMLE